MENAAYNDYQIFSPQVMEQLARAYFENQRQELEQKNVLGEGTDERLKTLLELYGQLEKRTFQKQKIIMLKKIIKEINEKLGENMNKSCKNYAKNMYFFNNFSQNNLIRKIINIELEIVEQTHSSPEFANQHIENIKTLVAWF